jgi:hypothetical protein
MLSLFLLTTSEGDTRADDLIQLRYDVQDLYSWTSTDKATCVLEYVTHLALRNVCLQISISFDAVTNQHSTLVACAVDFLSLDRIGRGFSPRYGSRAQRLVGRNARHPSVEHS